LDRRDQILAQLALNLRLIDQAGAQQAAQMVSLTGRPFERVLVDSKLIDAAGYQRLAQAFNKALAEANAQEAARQQAAAAAAAPPPDEDEVLGQPTVVLADSSDELVVPDEFRDPPTHPSAPEDELLAQPTVVLSDSSEDLSVPADFRDPPTRASTDDDVFAQPTMVLADEDPAPPTSAGGIDVILTESGDDLVVPDFDEGGLAAGGLALDDEDDILAQPTMVIEDDEPEGLDLPLDESGILAQPTMVLDESSAELEVPLDESGILAQPTMVLDDSSDREPGGPADIYAEPTMVIKDDALELQADQPSPRSRPMPGVKSKQAGGSLNREELQRRLKMRLGFEGFKVGDYAVLGEIARGAFGVVLEVEATGVTGNMAKQRGYSGRMALKVALENKTDPRETERFLTETRVQISFDHPHIVKIFDCGVEKGLTYYSMERIDGLEARSYVLKHGPMPPLLAARVALETAEALAYVHGRRIYHRDLKPQNVMLDTSKQPYRAVLIDFGLVVETDASKDKGLIVGTPSYMPPEQAKPRGGFGKINTTSDIYSLGATLFFLLTGKAPFTGRDPRKIIKQVVSDPPPDPCALNPAIPRRLGDVVLKCLAKPQKERYHSAKLLAADLEKELRAGKMKLKAKSLLGRFGLGKKK